MKKNKTKKKEQVAQSSVPVVINQGRLVRIDIMVGMMMVLVVLGHMNIDPRVPHWYTHGLLQWIYAFHMQVFIFLSGFLIRYSYKGVDTLKSYGAYIWRKIKKFFLGFLVVGISTSVAAALLTHHELGVASVWHDLKQLLLYPMWSEASFLWYIYVLLGFYLISPLYFKMPLWMQRALCIVALLLPMVQASEFLGAERFCKFTGFYCLGVQCAQGLEELKSIKNWSWGVLALPFVVFSVWMLYVGLQTQESQMPFLCVITGFMALPFVYFLAILIEKCGWMTRMFSRISRDCYWIYLLQMFVIWGLKYGLMAIGLDHSKWFFVIFVPCAVMLALIIPIGLAALFRCVLKTIKKSETPVGNLA